MKWNRNKYGGDRVLDIDFNTKHRFNFIISKFVI